MVRCPPDNQGRAPRVVASMAPRVSETLMFENLDDSLKAIEAGPPAFVVLEMDEGHERNAAVSVVRRLTPARPVQEFTFGPEALDIRALLARIPERDGEVVFLLGLSDLAA